MTFQEIINRINTYYPHGESTATVIDLINNAQSEISNYIGKLITFEAFTTIANQDEYAMPVGINDISEIKYIDISTTPTPTTRYDYMRYEYAPMDDIIPKMYSYTQVYDPIGTKSIVLYPIPIEAGRKVRITYRKKLANCTVATLNTAPEFDERFHNMIVYYCCYMICSSGPSPDTIQADAFKLKFEEAVNDIWRLNMTQEIESPRTRKDNDFWRR